MTGRFVGASASTMIWGLHWRDRESGSNIGYCSSTAARETSRTSVSAKASRCTAQSNGQVCSQLTEDYRSCEEPPVGKGARYDLYATAASSRSRRCRKATLRGSHNRKPQTAKKGFQPRHYELSSCRLWKPDSKYELPTRTLPWLAVCERIASVSSQTEQAGVHQFAQLRADLFVAHVITNLPRLSALLHDALHRRVQKNGPQLLVAEYR